MVPGGRNELRKQMGKNAQEASKIYDIRLTSKIMMGHYERLAQEASEYHRGLRYRVLRLMDKWR